MFRSEVKLIMDRTGLSRPLAVQLAESLQKRRRTFYIALYAIGPAVFALWMVAVNFAISVFEQRGVAFIDSMALGLILGPGVGFAAWLVASVSALTYAINRDVKRCLEKPLCFSCGFDLSGLPNGQATCPECGRTAWHTRPPAEAQHAR